LNTKERQGGVEAASALGGVFSHHHCRTGLFGSCAQPLKQAQNHQQYRGQITHLIEGGQGADQGAGNTHQQHRGCQHEFAPHTVTDHAEQHTAERAYGKTQEVSAEAGNQAHGAGLFREEQRPEDQCRGQGVEGEIVIFQSTAQGAGPGGAVQVFLVFLRFGDQVNIRWRMIVSHVGTFW